MKRSALLIVVLLVVAASPVHAEDATRQQLAKESVQLLKPTRALECDRLSAATVGHAQIVLGRLGNEITDLNYLFSEDFVGHLVKELGLRYLVGPYYGWRGCLGGKKCGVLVRMSKLKDRWIIEGTALKGTEPEPGKHYVYRAYATGGKDLPATVQGNIVDAKNGDPLEWNTYPMEGFEKGLCYTESIIDFDGNKRQPVFRIPKGMPCAKSSGR